MFRRAEKAVFEFVEDYELERSLTKEATRQYRYAAKSIDDWAGRPTMVHELNANLFNKWLRDISDGNLSPATVACRRRHLLALWRAAADVGMAEEPPRRLRPAKVPYVAPRAWTVEEIRAIMAVCVTLRRTRKGQIPRNVLWTLAVRVAWESGLRLSDLLRLRCDDIEPDGRAVVTQHKTSRPILIQLSEATVSLLAASLKTHPRKYVIPWPRSRESFRRQFALIVRRANVRKGTWKWIRRSSASDVEKACPGAGAAHLGHAHGSTIAARHYLDPYIIGTTRTMPTMLDN